MEKAAAILREHFSAYVILGQVGDPIEDKNQNLTFLYEGGFHNALGLLDDGHEEILHQRDDGEGEEE